MSQSVLEQIKGQLGQSAIQQLAAQVGIGEDKAKSAVDASVPALLSGLANNATSKDGAASLLSALKEHAGNPKLTDLAGMLSGGQAASEGQDILKHILGGKEEAVKKQVGEAAGILPEQAGGVLANLAPIVMGFLGNKAKSEGGFDIMSLMSLMQSEGGVAQGALGGMLSSVLGGGDGQDAGGVAQAGMKALGGLFGKK